MGIEKFLEIEIKGKKIKELAHYDTIDFLAHKKVAIDAFNFIYKNKYAMKDPLSFNENITAHIKITLNQIKKYQKLGIEQIWVFDGKFNINKAAKVKKRKMKVSKEEINDIKKLLKLSGIKYITVDVEAEFYCAELTKIGLYDFVLSSDTDTLMRGGNLMKINGDKIEYYYAKELLELVTFEELARMGAIIGCDFSLEKSKGIGPKKVYNNRNMKLSEGQEIALKELMMPVDIKKNIMENPKIEPNLEELNLWLKSLGFKIKD
jgi:5'-3' exonuclease